MGVKIPDNVHYTLANHNTPNQSEPIAFFWGSGFIEPGYKPVVQRGESSLQ